MAITFTQLLCSAVLQAAPDCAEALTRVAWLKQVALQDDAAACELLKSAIKAAPRDAKVHRVYGNVLFRAGKLAEAELRLLRAVWLDRTDATALLDLGHLLARQGRHQEARTRFQQAHAAAACREDATVADVAMAALYLAVGRPGDAHAFFARAQGTCPAGSGLASDENLLALASDFKPKQPTPALSSTERRGLPVVHQAPETPSCKAQGSQSAEADDPHFSRWECAAECVDATGGAGNGKGSQPAAEAKAKPRAQPNVVLVRCC